MQAVDAYELLRNSARATWQFSWNWGRATRWRSIGKHVHARPYSGRRREEEQEEEETRFADWNCSRTPGKFLTEKDRVSNCLRGCAPPHPMRRVRRICIIVRRRIRRISASPRRGVTFSSDQLLITIPEQPAEIVLFFTKTGNGRLVPVKFLRTSGWIKWLVFAGVKIDFEQGWILLREYSDDCFGGRRVLLGVWLDIEESLKEIVVLWLFENRRGNANKRLILRLIIRFL